jgi:putative autoinducer-2 (AI-2) aldolase
MGRNIFQSETPIAMLKAVHKVVHEGLNFKQAHEYFLELKNQKNG